MARDKFEDGAAILPAYEWEWGHETEDPSTQQIPVDVTAVTSGVGFVRQQGAATAKKIKYTGWIKNPEQLEKMQAYFNACAGIGTQSRTIIYEDIDATRYEVLITEFDPQRSIGRVGNGLAYVWKYTLEMEVIAVL